MAAMIDDFRHGAPARPIVSGAVAPAHIQARFHVARIAPFTHLFRHSFEIEALNREAMDPNPAFHPAAIAAFAMSSGLAPRLRLVLVHDADGVLRAFAPVVARSMGAPFRLPRVLMVAGIDDATPLIDRAAPDAAGTLVEGLAELGGARFDRIPAASETFAALVTAADALRNLRHAESAAGDQMGLDCMHHAPVADPDYRHDLDAARRELEHRFGKLKFERLRSNSAVARAADELRAFLPGANLPQGLDSLARADADDACLVLHRLRAGKLTLAISAGLVAGSRYAGLVIGFNRSADAPTTPPVFSVMLSEALLRDADISHATGGPSFISPAWHAEPLAMLSVGTSMQLEADRALGGLARLMRERAG